MDGDDSKALEFIQQAEKKLKGAGGGGGLLGGLISSNNDSKLQEAISLFEKAGNLYKMSKNWNEAGNAFLRAADAGKSLKSGSNVDICSNYIEAGNCFRKTNGKAAVDAIRKAIDICTENGRFSIAAKHHMSIAEIAESDMNDLELALQHYSKAADFFDGEQASSSSSKCRLKIAHIHANLNHYEMAIAIFEEIGKKNMESRLLQYGAREFFFKALICQMLLDLDAVSNEMLPSYQQNYPTFADSREFKLCQKLISLINADDVDGYSAALKEHDSIAHMEPFLTNIFLKIKKKHFADEMNLC